VQQHSGLKPPWCRNETQGYCCFLDNINGIDRRPTGGQRSTRILGSIAESAHIAFLHAVIESRTGVISHPDKAVSKEHPTVCMNWAPSKVLPKFRGNRRLPAGNHTSRADILSVRVPASAGPQIELATFAPGEIKTASLERLSTMDAIHLEAVQKFVKKSAMISGDQQKLMSSDCVQRLIKAALMEKNRNTHQLWRPAVPVFKTSRIMPETFVHPLAVELPPVADANEADTNESRVDSKSDTHEAHGAAE